MSTAEAPAVVLGLSETGLSVIRSLARRGVNVHGVTLGRERAHGQFTRHARFHRGPALSDEAAALEFLLSLGRELGSGTVLLPTGDENTLLLFRNRSELGERFRFLVWESEQMLAITSKNRFVPLMRELGIPVPDTRNARTAEEFREACAVIGLPVIVKPEQTHLWWSAAARGTSVYGQKAIPVRSAEDVETYARGVEASGIRVVIQKMIVGSDLNHVDYGTLIDAEGEVRAEFSARKHRVSPPRFGMGCFVESCHDDDAWRIGREVFSRLGYRGHGMAQFKRDERDGALYLMEINPRFTVWTGLTVACGVDYPWLSYCLAAGLPIGPPPRYADGTLWINAERDFFTARQYVHDGDLRWSGWLRDLMRADVGAYFRWSDPLPGLYSFYRVVRRVAGALLRRLSRPG